MSSSSDNVKPWYKKPEWWMVIVSIPVAIAAITSILPAFVDINHNITLTQTSTFTNSINMTFVLIPAGEFDMGPLEIGVSSFDYERLVHHVKLAKAFYMGKYEITQKQWREVMGNNPSKFKGDDRPVENISWDEVQQFIKKLNEKEGTKKYRLPSEEEWEYAARAGTKTRYSFGDDESKLGDYAWFNNNSGNSGTQEVGLKSPNTWGLYDMYGNVWEWVQDSWHSDYKGAPDDGRAWESGSSRVFRGGAWTANASLCRSASRSGDVPGSRHIDVGFRLVKDL